MWKGAPTPPAGAPHAVVGGGGPLARARAGLDELLKPPRRRQGQSTRPVRGSTSEGAPGDNAGLGWAPPVGGSPRGGHVGAIGVHRVNPVPQRHRHDGGARGARGVHLRAGGLELPGAPLRIPLRGRGEHLLRDLRLRPLPALRPRPASRHGAAEPRVLRLVPAYWLALAVIAAWLGLSGVFTPRGIVTYFGFLQVYDPDTFKGGL